VEKRNEIGVRRRTDSYENYGIFFFFLGFRKRGEEPLVRVCV